MHLLASIKVRRLDGYNNVEGGIKGLGMCQNGGVPNRFPFGTQLPLNSKPIPTKVPYPPKQACPYAPLIPQFGQVSWALFTIPRGTRGSARTEIHHRVGRGSKGSKCIAKAFASFLLDFKNFFFQSAKSFRGPEFVGKLRPVNMSIPAKRS